jgi:hypothetical protein
MSLNLYLVNFSNLPNVNFSNVYFSNLPNDIIQLIYQHLNALIIQKIFKTNRPLTPFSVGDRVLIKDINIFYGTISKICGDYCNIRLLPRLIPNWKKCNIAFWKCYENFMQDYNFPYYYPKVKKVSKDNIIKLNNWDDNYKIDTSKRIDMYYNYKNNKILNKELLDKNSQDLSVPVFTTKSNMFGYWV